jgi:hypothetical protein
MRVLQLALIYANWAGSLLFGWLHAPLWLLVPVAGWASFAFGATAAIQTHQRANGIANSQYGRRMLGPNLRLIGRNAGINVILFAAAWTVSSLTGAVT